MRGFVVSCVAAAALLAAVPSQAATDPALLLQNPYAAPAGRPEPASLEIEATVTRDGQSSRHVVSLAETWVAAADAEAVTVFDFAGNRQFIVRDSVLESRNPAALPVFRLMEFQNRAFLNRVLAAGDVTGMSMAPCDVANELGVAVPIKDFTADARIERTATGGRLICGGREYGRFEAGDRQAPSSFWSYFANTFWVHPALLRAMKEDGRLPRSVTVTHQMGDKSHARRSWALGAARTVQTASPLRGDLRVDGDAVLPERVRARVKALAQAALGGEAAGGAPKSLADWDARVRAVEARQGKGAALLEAMAGMQIVSTDTRCTAAGSATCEQIAAIRERARDEPVVAAYFRIIQAEQKGAADAAVDAYASVKDAGDHPVLGAAYALALHKLSPKGRELARKSLLPTDALELHLKAVEAYPYSPAYWSDLGDWFAGQYDYAAAFYCWDVAASLPVPAVQPELTGVMLAKRKFVQRIRADFPEMFAP